MGGQRPRARRPQKDRLLLMCFVGDVPAVTKVPFHISPLPAPLCSGTHVAMGPDHTKPPQAGRAGLKRVFYKKPPSQEKFFQGFLLLFFFSRKLQMKAAEWFLGKAFARGRVRCRHRCFLLFPGKLGPRLALLICQQISYLPLTRASVVTNKQKKAAFH